MSLNDELDAGGFQFIEPLGGCDGTEVDEEQCGRGLSDYPFYFFICNCFVACLSRASYRVLVHFCLQFP